jgi:hypothetical protein
MNDIIIGSIGNYSKEQLYPFVKSLNSCGFLGRKILMSYNSSAELTQWLTENGIEVYNVEHDIFGNKIDKFPCHSGMIDRTSTDLLIHHHRFYSYWRLFNELGLSEIKDKYRYILHVDIKDIIFQLNPSDYFDKFMYKSIIASSEYLKYEVEKWNAELSITNTGPYIHEYLVKYSDVYNVGSFVTNVQDFVDICLLMYLLCYRREKLNDQPSMAILFNTAYKDKVYTATMKDGFILQCGTIAEPTTFQKYKSHFKELPPIILNGRICNSDGKIFTAVHQYERVPKFKQLLEEKYQ